MEKSIKLAIAITLSCLICHAAIHHDTHLDKFVDELSILSRLVGGISIQSKLVTQFADITAELIEFDLTQFSNVSTEPIVKTIEGMFAKSQKLDVTSDFKTIAVSVRILNELVKNVERFEKGLVKDSMYEYKKEWKLLKRAFDSVGPNGDILHAEVFEEMSMKEVFECVRVKLEPSEIRWCFSNLKTAANTYDKNEKLKKNIKDQQEFHVGHYVTMVREAQHVFDKLLVVNALEMIHDNKQTLDKLESLLNSSNKDLQLIEQIVKGFELNVSTLAGIVNLKPNLKRSGRITNECLPNGLDDLKTLSEDLRGKFLKETLIENGAHWQKLSKGLAPLLKYSAEVAKTANLTDEWRSSDKKNALEVVGKFLKEIDKWKRVNTFTVQEDVIHSINTCFVDLPVIKGPFDRAEIEHTKSTVIKLIDQLKNLLGYHSAITLNGTLIYNGFETIVKVVRLHMDVLGGEDLEKAKKAFDMLSDELRMDPEYVVFETFYSELLKNYTSFSPSILDEVLRADAKLETLEDILKREDGKKVLKVINCLKDQNFTADNMVVMLNGARGICELANSSSIVHDSISYLNKIHEIQKSFKLVKESIKSNRRRRAANATEVEQLNQFARETDGSLRIQAGEAVMRNMLSVQKQEKLLQQVLNFQTNSSDAFYKRWKNVGRRKVTSVIEDVKKLEDYIDHHKSEGLHRMIDVLNEASRVEGVSFEWDGMDEFFESTKINDTHSNFTSLKLMPLDFASKRADFTAATMSLTILQQFLDKFFDVKRNAESLKSVVFFTSETIGSTALLIVCILITVIVLAVIGYFLTPGGRNRIRRWYLQKYASPEMFELYWRYSYWADQESEKNQLCEAIREVNFDHVKDLVKKGAYINVYNSFGNTPLHAATKYGHANMVEVLIRNGADRKARNFENKMPEEMTPDAAVTTSRMNESMSTSREKNPKLQKDIQMIYSKYKHKQFRQRIPDLLPTMLYHIRIDGKIKKNATKLFMKKYSGNVTDQMSGVTHLIVPTDKDGVLTSDDFGYIMCVFLPTMLMQEQWMRACLEKKSHFRDDYKFRVEKVRYKGKVFDTVLKWAQWVHKQMLPYLFGVQLHLCADVGDAVSSQLRQLVEMHGATWCEEVPVKEHFNLGSHPFHHFHLGPLFVIHGGNVQPIEHLKNDDMYTLMTFDEFIVFMLQMKVKYDPERRTPIPVQIMAAIEGGSESELPTASRASHMSSKVDPLMSQKV